ncbi:Uma2 family endonuclease [Actinocrinis puniceicyclus]|uniref:Uma2 family endonuclease n=1 Tax=Actinocrinis puniceicyclus TaxID=977794 RepID=A0A8J8BB41_9ACTN|nr:Uma2 family endonuclease [Actinocrinis puniceicyclus]MBS2961701.1 Uma2 family endonuclease [Actinocrinis puniceicyclus]
MVDRIGRGGAVEPVWDTLTHHEDYAIPYWVSENVTVHMWQAMPESLCRRLEVVDGRAVLLGSPTDDHQGAALSLGIGLRSHARAYAQASGRPVDALYGYDLRLRTDPLHHRRPDVIVYGQAPGRGLPTPSDTLLVVEVVSPSSRVIDTVHKSAEYAAAGVPHYWTVETGDGSICAISWYALPDGDKRYRLRAQWTPQLTPEGIWTDAPFPIRIAWDELAF